MALQRQGDRGHQILLRCPASSMRMGQFWVQRVAAGQLVSKTARATAMALGVSEWTQINRRRRAHPCR